MVQWVIRSIPCGGPTEIFFVPASVTRLVTKTMVCWWNSAALAAIFISHGAISCSSQCSTTGVTKVVVCAILYVRWCI